MTKALTDYLDGLMTANRACVPIGEYPIGDRSRAGALWTDCYTCRGRGILKQEIQIKNNKHEWLAGCHTFIICPVCFGVGMDAQSYHFACREQQQ